MTTDVRLMHLERDADEHEQASGGLREDIRAMQGQLDRRFNEMKVELDELRDDVRASTKETSATINKLMYTVFGVIASIMTGAILILLQRGF